ncbi:hypothetical protein D3C77_751570 [compost metagenome]
MKAEHIFSHIHWYLRVFRFQEAAALSALSALAGFAAEAKAPYNTGADTASSQEEEQPYEYRWITAEDMNDLAFPNVFIKILNQYFSE